MNSYFINKLKYSLGSRLIITILSVFVILSFVFISINVFLLWRKSLADFNNGSERMANLVAYSNSVNIWNMDYSNVKEYIASLAVEKSLISVIFEIEDNLHIDRRIRFYGLANGKEIDLIASSIEDVAPDKDSYSSYIERPIRHKDSTIGKVHLYFSNRFIINETISQLSLAAVNLILFIFLFSFFLYFSLKLMLLKPLSEIHKMALSVSSFTTYLSESVSQEKWQHVHNLLMVERELHNKFEHNDRKDELGDFIVAFWLVLNGFEVVVSELAQYSAQLQVMNDELEQRITERTIELEESNKKSIEALNALQKTQGQLIQQEKLASIGQLAAGVAHEINNPIGYVGSNINRLGEYFEDLKILIDEMESILGSLPTESYEKIGERLSKIKKNIDFDFVIEDFSLVIDDCREGVLRVKDIVQSLKDFSHGADENEFSEVDINEAIKTTLKVVNNEIKYLCETHLELNLTEKVSANVGQVHQVISNIIVNAAHAMKDTGKHGQLYIRSNSNSDTAFIEIQDTGNGIPPSVQPKIFDPFFTTKPIGQGTGLGLNICYDIVVNKHNGNLRFHTEQGVGTTFIIELPLRREPEMSLKKVC